MTRSLGFEVHLATIDDRPVLKNLLELYLYDFSSIGNFDVDSSGQFGYADLPKYWEMEGRFAYIATLHRKLAGFALVKWGSVIKENAEVWDMQEFFVMRKYRNKGVGSKLARWVWREHPGQWEIRVIKNNSSALQFWSKGVNQEYPSHEEPISACANGKTYTVFRFEAR